MIDIEKEKQQLEREELIEEGIETEMEFAKAANAFKAANDDITEKTLPGRLSASDLRKKLTFMSD